MTSVEDPLAVAPTAPVPVVAPAQPIKDRVRVIGRRGAGIALVTVIVILLAGVLVEDPIASVWYSFRQQHLSSQFANPGVPHTGSPLAVIQISTQQQNQVLNEVVVQGDNPGVLRAGPGHQPSSVMPGARGNSVIFGHRDSWGGPFSKLGQVKKGDSIFVERRTKTGDLAPVFFTVTSVDKVRSGDRSPLAPSNDHRLTLVTSAGGGKRLIVQGVSGKTGHRSAPTAATLTSTGSSGGTIGTSLIWLGICVVGAAAVLLLARRRHGSRILVIALAPFALGALLSLILTWDAALVGTLS